MPTSIVMREGRYYATRRADQHGNPVLPDNAVGYTSRGEALAALDREEQAAAAVVSEQVAAPEPTPEPTPDPAPVPDPVPTPDPVIAPDAGGAA